MQKTRTFFGLFVLAFIGSVFPAFAQDASQKSEQEIVVENPTFPPAQLGIAPPRVEKDLALTSAGRLDQSITIYNYSDQPKRFHLTLIDTDSAFQAVASTERALAPWTILNPTDFTIPAKGEQTVRLSIRPAPEFPTGTHYARLKISQQIVDSVKLDDDQKGITLSLGSNYGLPIIVHVK